MKSFPLKANNLDRYIPDTRPSASLPDFKSGVSEQSYSKQILPDFVFMAKLCFFFLVFRYFFSLYSEPPDTFSSYSLSSLFFFIFLLPASMW